MKTVENISLERVEQLAKQAGHVFVEEKTAFDMLANSQMNVMFLRFAVLIEKELKS